MRAEKWNARDFGPCAKRRMLSSSKLPIVIASLPKISRKAEAFILCSPVSASPAPQRQQPSAWYGSKKIPIKAPENSKFQEAIAPAVGSPRIPPEIGRASCRERVGQYV